MNDEITPSFECVYKYKMPVEYTKHSQWEFSFISIISKKRERKCEKKTKPAAGGAAAAALAPPTNRHLKTST